jgi:hypothetical protein
MQTEKRMGEHAWVRPIQQKIAQHGGRGGFIVIFPDYRPDLFRGLAYALGLANFDYRSEVMSVRGWDADQLTLDELDADLSRCAADTSTVVSNVEALLSTKSEEACSRWLHAFLGRDQDNAVLIPIVIHSESVPRPHPRVHELSGEQLPVQTLLRRLSF